MKNKKSIITLALVMTACLCAACSGVPAAAAESTKGVGTLTAGIELFTERDRDDSPEIDGAAVLTVSDGENITIDAEGVYVLRGTAKQATVTVDAEGAKPQLVLDGLTLANSDFPCIYIKNADKVFVTTSTDSSLTVTGAFRGDGETNTDGVIFSRSDLVLNGSASLSIRSSDNGVVSKDDLKICSGSYDVEASGHALEGRDSVRVAGGSLILTAGKDAIHSDNDEDAEKGFLYVSGGEFAIRAADDGLHACSFVQIDGGSFSIIAAEGIESTYALINDGKLDIHASDDGINAAQKSGAYRPTVEINGGEISIEMGQGDTDGVDSNGELIINGGTIAVRGVSCFDAEGTVSFTGGTVYVNGERVSTIPVQRMGGPGGMGIPGGPGGGWDRDRGGRDGRRGERSGEMGGTAPNGFGVPPGGFGAPPDGSELPPEEEAGDKSA